MTQRLNPNIAKALDMELPENEPVEDSSPVIEVLPHEVVVVDNEELPEMSDIEHTMIEGQKQLEELIGKGMGMFSELYEELPEIEPKYRNRHLEITALIMGNTLDAIKHKTDLQIKRKDQRLKEASFRTPGESNSGNVTNNFFGSREDLMELINGNVEVIVEEDNKQD